MGEAVDVDVGEEEDNVQRGVPPSGHHLRGVELVRFDREDRRGTQPELVWLLSSNKQNTAVYPQEILVIKYFCLREKQLLSFAAERIFEL